MLISNSLLHCRQAECEQIGVCVHVCVSLASPTALGLELVEVRESTRPRDNPSGLFPYKTYGKMQKLFFSFPPTIAINILHRTFAHVPLRTGIPVETQSSWRIRKRRSGIFSHSTYVFSVCWVEHIAP